MITLKPHFTEKTARQAEESNSYVFLVSAKYDKAYGKKLVEKIYGVRVIGVSTLLCRTRKKRTKVGYVDPKLFKKLIVRLPADQKIEFAQGV